MQIPFSLISHAINTTTQRSILQTMQTQDEKGEYIREDEENTDCYFTNLKKNLFCLSNKNVNRRSSEPAETRASL